MKIKDYQNEDNITLVIERFMIKAQMDSILEEAWEINPKKALKYLASNPEMAKLDFAKTAIEDELISRKNGFYNVRDIDRNEKWLYEKGEI